VLHVSSFFYDMIGISKYWTGGSSYTDCGGTAFDDCRGGNSCEHDCRPSKPSIHSTTWGSLAINFRWIIWKT
jgi:hypothetical protein